MAVVRHLGYLGIHILTASTVHRVNVHIFVTFCANRSNNDRDIAVFQFLKMATVRHLGFLKVPKF